MNLGSVLDQLIGVFSPRTALARVAYREMLSQRSGYEGARQDWRATSWRNEAAGANLALVGDLPILRNRARSLVRNNPLAKRSLEVLVGHTVGCGLRPSFKTDSRAQRKRLTDAWARFAETADTRRQTTIYGLQEQAVRGMFESGEALTLRDVRKRNGAPVLSYLVMEGDHIDHSREGIFDGRVTRLGVSLEKDGHAPDGYWLWEQNPSDAILFGTYPYPKWVPIEGINHLYRIRRPGQMRGVSEFAAILPLMRDLADYMEAALVKARAEANFVGVVKSQDAGAGSLATRRDTAPDGTDRIYGEMSPGMLHRLDQGEDIVFSQPSSNPNFAPFTLQAQQQAAAGVGVTYDQATGDLRQANYSSLKAGKIDFRVIVEMIRDLTITPQLLTPIYRDFVDFGRTFGVLSPSDERVPVEWIAPGWEPIDPLKDLEADILAVRSGRKTWGEFVLEWGRDPQQQIEDIARFNAELDAASITLDTDPRKVAAGGKAQATVADPAPPKD